MTTPVTALPRGWYRLPTAELEVLSDHLDDSTEDWERVNHELEARDNDVRFNRGEMGCDPSS